MIMPRRSADIGASTCGLYILGGKSVIVVRNYIFTRLLTWPTSIHDAQSDLNTFRRNRITPVNKKDRFRGYLVARTKSSHNKFSYSLSDQFSRYGEYYIIFPVVCAENFWGNFQPRIFSIVVPRILANDRRVSPAARRISLVPCS